MARFTVDTHLFRELGELLVGRDSTALIELVKNSYDADATEVTVFGEGLSDPKKGRIVIVDNGVGMSSSSFEDGFLRVASRLKEAGERRSLLYHRRYTGAKGIGRLAAHKLARKLSVESVPIKNGDLKRYGVKAVIDWDAVEKYETLDKVAEDAVSVEPFDVALQSRSGTTITLQNLRRTWTPTERARFFAEVQSFEVPGFLKRRLPPSLVTKPLLFSEPLIRQSDDNGKQFGVRLEGDFATGEDYWQLITEFANWVIEIQAKRCTNEVQYVIAPTRRVSQENPQARTYRTSLPHPSPSDGPFFEARIFVREGPMKLSSDQRAWASASTGVRVYMEGFRVLPYGDPRDDWLALDFDYTRRARQLEVLGKWELPTELESIADEEEGLSTLPNNNYFGAVFLVHEGAPTLRLLVNREGFVVDSSFDTLSRLVRAGIDIGTRVRAAAGYSRRQQRKEDRARSKSQDDGSDTSDYKSEAHQLRSYLDQASVLLKEIRVSATSGDTEAAKKASATAEQKLDQLRHAVIDLMSEQSLLRVLASVGTQMASFVHEINALLGTSHAVESALAKLRDDQSLDKHVRRRLREVLAAMEELRRGLEKQASYLTDVITPDARRRRSRQSLRERFDGALRLVEHQAERRGIRILNEIPPELTSPPMFRAELTTVVGNLLTNAIKAAGNGGMIQASGKKDAEGSTRIVIQNTGAHIDLAEAERWFQPFESSTSEVDPVLGQGMGLGLPITRRLLADYGADIKFVRPSRGFATAIEIDFPS